MSIGCGQTFFKCHHIANALTLAAIHAVIPFSNSNLFSFLPTQFGCHYSISGNTIPATWLWTNCLCFSPGV
jgi:hypothetical protein